MPSKGKVLVAMSGGVDSSVAAALLMREGYEVVGVFMRLGSPGETLDELTPFDSAGVSCDPAKVKIGHQGCCSINDAADAREVAGELGIPFYVCNFKKDFGRIIDYFVDTYAQGSTPNPCVRCNDWLKFGKLHDYARQIDADFVASGHYARVEDGRLLRGVDTSKDQSYVLFGVPRAKLGAMMLPIGGYEKPRVRELAEELGLPVFDKPDSQEICFVPDNDYAGLVERRRPELARAGKILDEAGNEVGEHDGQHRFTIGQRRGVGVALGYPIYVVEKDPRANTITVGDGEGLFSSSCSVGEANWLVDDPPSAWTPAWVQHRYNSPAVRAEVRTAGEMPDDEEAPSGRRGVFEVRFAERQRAVAPGQALVVYDAAEPSVVLGGGWIRSASRVGASARTRGM
ncbi:MAG: tRNA 2-thiouridine(34) synthase MnmA [Phycisphaerales bacterium]